MRGTRFTLLVAIVTLAATVFPAHASSDAVDGGFLGGRDCRETRLFVPTEVSRLDGIVPPNFKVEQTMGQAYLFVNVVSCNQGTYLGEPVRGHAHFAISEVGVFIGAPDGSDGIHYYEISSVTNMPLFYNYYHQFGMRKALMSHGYQTIGPGLRMTAGVGPWHGEDFGPYSFGAEGAMFSAPNNLRYVGWTISDGRNVAMEKLVSTSASGFGVGELHLSDHWKFADSGTYPAIISKLDFQAKVNVRP